MSIEKRFDQYSALDNQEVIKREKRKEETIDTSKRKFLKIAGAAGLGAVLGYIGISRLIKELGEEEEKEEGKPVSTSKIEHKEETEKEPELIITEEQKEILKEDRKSIEEIIDFDSPEPIKFNLDTVKALENHWGKKYRSDLKPSLDYAYREIGAWEPELRRMFREERVPEKFIYLAIPESHWKTDANSGYAVGPYQFTERTGRKFKLRQLENVDERRDPMKSGRACAKYLRTLYKKTEDWNLSLSLYNGGFAWKYLGDVYENNRSNKTEKLEISYENYLAYIETKLNNIKKYVKESQILTYKVARGDTLAKIARYYKISLNELSLLNNIKDIDSIKMGQELKLPTADVVRKRDFLRLVNGYKQNLNYPAKFNAVYKIIEEGNVPKQKEQIKFTKIIKVKQGKDDHIHIFKKKDINIYRLSLKFKNIKYSDILRANPNIDPNSLMPGTEITIPRQVQKVTLESLAREHNIRLDRLKYLNPAVINENRPLPNGLEIRA